MSDGVHLAVDVYLPRGGGRYPALLAASAYGKDSMGPGLPLSPDNLPGVEHGHPEFLTRNGYALVVADLRGSGDSEGEMSVISEGDDCAQLVDWMARQEWCDGSVGMMGISWFARLQVPTAIRRPPALKAIMPFEPAVADFYRDGAYHGGLLNKQFLSRFHSSVKALEQEPVTPMMLSPAELAERIAHIRELPEYHGDGEVQAVLDDPMRNPQMFDILLHPEDGDFYRLGSWEDASEQIDIPTYIGAWGNVNVVDAFGAFRVFNKLTSAHKKLIIGPPVFPDRPYWQYGNEILRWYGRWLKGERNGIEDEPPIRIFVTGENTWRHANQWPLTGTRWTPFYLQPGGWVHEYPPTEADSSTSYRYEQDAHHSAFFQSSTLVEDTDVIGPLAFHLHAACTVDDTAWIVSLYDVFPDGRRFFLTRGWLKASHRALDTERSRPWQPYHPHRHPSPIEPGAVHEYAIEMMPIAHRFQAGHRLGIEISSDENGLVEGGRGWLASLAPVDEPLIDELCLTRLHTPHAVDRRPKTLTVYHDAGRASHLLAPITGGNVVGTSNFLRPDPGIPTWLR